MEFSEISNPLKFTEKVQTLGDTGNTFFPLGFFNLNVSHFKAKGDWNVEGTHASPKVTKILSGAGGGGGGRGSVGRYNGMGVPQSTPDLSLEKPKEGISRSHGSVRPSGGSITWVGGSSIEGVSPLIFL